MTDPFKNRLERWKRSLIDLTKRNRLINYTPSRVTTIQIISESPELLFKSLQLDGKSLKFLPARQAKQQEEQPQEQVEGQTVVVTDQTQRADQSQERELKEDEEKKENQEQKQEVIGNDKFLQTLLSEEKLNDSLLRIFRKSTLLFEEQGLSTLFLALGILEWREENEPDQILAAPLLLLPVELTRKLAWQDFSLKSTGEDPVINPALVEQLRLGYELLMPELPEGLEEFDLQAFYSFMEEIISKQKNWRIKRNIYLDFFSFQKFLMYKDMERYESHYQQNPLIQALCNLSGSKLPALPSEIEKADLDQILLPENTFHVLDADSSQQRAILAAKSNHNLIIEGPPGTGKSQTIANLIADALADKKTVLFVSEKMAALEVVYKRLETIGLHDFCLQLHSHKTNKKAVYDEIIRVLDNTRPADHGKDSELVQLGYLKDFLNKFARELHTPFGKLAEKPFDVLGQLALVLSKAPIMQAPLKNIADISAEEFQKNCSDLQDLVSIMHDLGEPKKHPWYGTKLEGLSNAQLASLNDAISKAIEAYKQVQEYANDFAQYMGIVQPKNIEQVNILCDAANTIAQSNGSNEEDLKNEAWQSMPQPAIQLIEHGKTFADLKERLLSYFKPELLEADFKDLRERFNSYSQSWLRFIKPDYWKDKQFLSTYLLPSSKNLGSVALNEHLNYLHQYQKEKAYVLEYDEIGKQLFAKRWSGLTSDWKMLEAYAQWLVQMHYFIKMAILQDKAIELAILGTAKTTKVVEQIKTLQEMLGYLVASLHEFLTLANFSQEGAAPFAANTSIEQSKARLFVLQENINRLHHFAIYNQKLNICLNGIAGAMIERFFNDGYETANLLPTFKRFFYERWLDQVFLERPRLSAFNSLVHEQKIDDFRGLDIKSIKLARQRLLYKLYTARELQLANPFLGIELGILQRELRKKARHIPLRKLFSKVPNIMRSVKPCFMMSPMSAALFLDPNINTFDLVIFDEASQVSTEDAVGSLVRAKQAVVVGDPKQLPPTNFFHMQIVQAEEQTTDEDGVLDDVDSVLDEFVSVGFAKQSLLWHYRSQHESLIEFSNRNFYKNLLTFPAPHFGTEELGLQFNFVDGKYKGQGVNPIEARAVADAVCEHIKKMSHLSLGVGTFNMNQQQLILDELEERRRNDSSLEFFFARKGEDQFFVKNLENIQGDERDVIFISITYGPDEFGKIRYNFGPVNGENGWRRLNVIFTRAKRCLKVFSSMHGEEIDPTKIQSQGAKLLRDFLIFAEKRQRTLNLSDRQVEIENPLERSVYEELTKRGLKLLPRVGESGYRIDFGVISEDETYFIAGIECDSTNYYSASTARDRDRLRQNVLESLGWTIIRIWSVDWWRDKAGQIERILRLVSEAQYKPIKSFGPTINVEPPAEKTEDVNLPSDIQGITAPRKIFGVLNNEVNDKGYDQAPSVPPYKLTLLSPLGQAEEFLLADNQILLELLERIITRESPIHVTDISKRVASFWQITRLNKPIKEKIESLLLYLVNKQRIIIKGEFIWIFPENNSPADNRLEYKNIVRNRLGLDYVFDPEQICDEEYEEAILLIIKTYGVRSRDKINQDVARLLGFTRAGTKINTKVNEIVQHLIDKGIIINIATGLTLAKFVTESQSVQVSKNLNQTINQISIE